MQFRKFFCFVTPALLLATTAAFAADNEPVTAPPSNDGLTVGIGVGAAPDYLGSDDYTAIPLPTFDWKYDGFGLRSSGLGIEADLLPFEGFEAGPIVRYDLGRSSVEDALVKRLPDVDPTLEVGGFIGFGIPLTDTAAGAPTILTMRLESVSGVSGGHGGNVTMPSLGLVQPFGEDLTAIFDVSASYMSGQYADDMFGITAAGAAASGLAAYNPDAGFRDVSAGIVMDYKMTENLSTYVIGRYTRLVGDAADSPIVATRGSEDQFLAGVGVSYKLY
jgi:MipA family protein